MFVNFNGDWPPQPEPPATPPEPRVDRQGEARFAVVIVLNLILLLIAPLAGVTLFQAFGALFGG